MTKHTKVLDLFAGAGGFSLGLEMAGLDIIGCLEKDFWAADTLHYNKSKQCKIIQADIQDYQADNTILNAFDEKPNIIIGGPPCQGFSSANKFYDPNDPRNSLFKNYAKWIHILKPDIFVMENVSALKYRKTSEGKFVLDIIKQEFVELYNVDYWILNAVDYGVPQLRERIFIFGTLKEKYGSNNLEKPQPTHSLDIQTFQNLKPAITVWEALSDLPLIKAGQGHEYSDYSCDANNDYQKKMRIKSKGIFNHVAMRHTERLVSRYEQILNGQNLAQLEDNLKVQQRNGKGISLVKYNSNYRILQADKPSFTIPASFYSNFIHPKVPRNITAREAARLQSFPDRYCFKGKRTQISSKLLKRLGKDDEDFLSQYNQIGNAVPPLLAKNIAEMITIFLEKHTIPTNRELSFCC